LVWQLNHNPDNEPWSIDRGNGFLRITTGRVDTSFYLARNTLTQCTVGPHSSGSTLVDLSNMKEGDFAGLALRQRKYGQVGVKYEHEEKFIVMINAESGNAVEKERLPLEKSSVYLKAVCDFTDLQDEANFYYSLDGKKWIKIGGTLHMEYTLPHFMGYRFGLFNYATKSATGFVDFDYFHISNQP
jgi:beta-xylosidase